MRFANYQQLNNIICPTFEVSKIEEYQKNKKSGGLKGGYYKSSYAIVGNHHLSSEGQQIVELTKPGTITLSEFSNNLKLFAKKVINDDSKPLVVLFLDEAQV